MKVKFNVLGKVRAMLGATGDKLVAFKDAVISKIVAILCLRGIARGVKSFFAGVKSFLAGIKHWLGRVVGHVQDFLGDITGHLKRIPYHLQAAVTAVISWRPPARTWTLLMSVVAIGVGAGLVVGPARSLATGETFHWLARVALGGQLLTGLATLLAGMGILLLMPSYRRFLQLAFVGSVAPAGAFIYQTILYAQKMRLASPENQDLYALKVSGGVQL